MLNNTVKVLSLLEGTKFSPNNDINVMSIASELFFSSNKNFWSKGTKEREQLKDIAAGNLVLNTEAFTLSQNLDNLVRFIQGILLFDLSLVNGIGRSPINAVRKSETEIQVKFFNKSENIKLTIGKYNKEFGKLIREFKNIYYGKANDEYFAKNELALIKETFKETATRLRNESKFMSKVAKDPLSIFKQDKTQNFSAGLFIILSALPLDTLNTLLMNIGSYLPAELEETNEDMFKINVRHYLTSSTTDQHELFKKIRLLLKLYSGRQREIISIIVKEKTKDYFQEIIHEKNVKEQINEHIQKTILNQFDIRLKILDGLVRLL